MPRLVGDLGNGFGVLGYRRIKPYSTAWALQPAEGLGVFKALVSGRCAPGCSGRQQGRSCAPSSPAGSRWICRPFQGLGFAQALIAEILGLLVVEVLLVVSRCGSRSASRWSRRPLAAAACMGKKRIGGFGLQGLVHSGGRAARLGGKGMSSGILFVWFTSTMRGSSRMACACRAVSRPLSASTDAAAGAGAVLEVADGGRHSGNGG